MQPAQSWRLSTRWPTRALDMNQDNMTCSTRTRLSYGQRMSVSRSCAANSAGSSSPSTTPSRATTIIPISTCKSWEVKRTRTTEVTPAFQSSLPPSSVRNCRPCQSGFVTFSSGMKHYWGRSRHSTFQLFLLHPSSCNKRACT